MYILKCNDIVKLNIVKCMFTIINNCTPFIIVNMFSIKQCLYIVKTEKQIFRFVIPSFF